MAAAERALAGARRFPGRPDPRNPADRAAAHQGCHRHGLAAGRGLVAGSTSSRRRCSRASCMASLRSGPAVPAVCVPFVAVRIFRSASVDPAAGDASRCSDAAALSLRLDRNQPADLRAVSAHELDGTGAGAWVTPRRWPISSSSFSRRCGSISGCPPSPVSSPRRELFAMAMLYHPPASPPSRAPEFGFHWSAA